MELKDIKGIGSVTLEKLNIEGIKNSLDLIHTFPKKYNVYEIDNENVLSGNQVTVEAVIDSKVTFVSYRKNVKTVIFYAIINYFRVKCVTFSQEYLRYKLNKGSKCILYGRYKRDINTFTFTDIFFDEFKYRIEVEYKLKAISNSMMHRAVKGVFSTNPEIEESLPIELLDKYKLYNASKYVYLSHFPQTKEDYIQIQRRRKYEEFFWYSISLMLLSENNRRKLKTPRNIDREKLSAFIRNLPFELTSDQSKVIDEIALDMQSVIPMNRLVQGDVGSGKTIVAIIAAYLTYLDGYQVAVMVPTELLANQQYNEFKACLSSFGITIELLTSSIKKSTKSDILYRLAHGRVGIVIGTHALLEENVMFNKLGLCVIDEQHKFGVIQRQRLLDKIKGVDSLFLTATPIPRTLGLTRFGDLDISSIEVMPKGRKPVITSIVRQSDMDDLIPIINNHLNRNEQIYIVVPMVMDNPDYDVFNIESAYEYFSSRLSCNIAVAHGKQKAIDRNQIMQDFKYKKYDILIATTVIEVGINVPNCQAMIILNAERFGLSQIHQLRGRVGRSEEQSYCYLVSNNEYCPRLKVLEASSNGFDIAAEDFNLRGPGDYLGDSQSGHVALDYADFQTDFKIWKCAYEDSKVYIKRFMKKELYSPKWVSIVKNFENQRNKIN